MYALPLNEYCNKTQNIVAARGHGFQDFTRSSDTDMSSRAEVKVAVRGPWDCSSEVERSS